MAYGQSLVLADGRAIQKGWAALTAGGTACASGSAVTTSQTVGFDVSAGIPKNHTIQLVVTGGPATCTAQLCGSIDGGTTWGSLSGDQTCTSSVMFHVDARPALMVKVSLSALTGGTSPTVMPIYVGGR